MRRVGGPVHRGLDRSRGGPRCSPDDLSADCAGPGRRPAHRIPVPDRRCCLPGSCRHPAGHRRRRHSPGSSWCGHGVVTGAAPTELCCAARGLGVSPLKPDSVPGLVTVHAGGPHSGVVNAGAILLIRFAPAIAPHQSVMIGVFVAGAVTLVYASAVRLVRPDVKGRLVFSTMAQMGFMIMACGLGVFAAAIFHLVAHSLFKSTLSLGAGMGVRHHAVDRDLPPRQIQSPFALAAAMTLSVLVPLAALTAAEWVFSPTVSPCQRPVPLCSCSLP
ncbi:hypothetical protein E3O53_10415 [Cryobacterium sp. TMT2-18-3]|nr:hypothetical protein E3O22_04650 [Cryobacterium sp. TMT2-18-2]TFC63624.1 hypothetical protein E3O53_10415 [Cryobacterium sp. TMT2-18-3]